MNKQSRILLAVALAALAGIAGWKIFQVFREKEPAYGGKQLTFWLSTYAPSSSWARHSPEWNEADQAVRHLGTNCIPTLLRMIRQKDSRVKLWLVAVAQEYGPKGKIHFVPAGERNAEASRAFIALGDRARDAVPALVKMCDDNVSVESRCAIADALAWIGPGAKPAVPMLLRATTNANPKLRANALWAMGEIHAEPELCVPRLIHALTDSNEWAQLSAAHALGRFGPDARSAIPSLVALTNAAWVSTGRILSAQMQVGLEARNSLKKIDPPAVSPTFESFSGRGIRE